MPSKLIDDIKSAVANIASYINNDGGNLEFISFNDKKLVLRISGACVGCEAFDSTFDGVKESLLIEFKNKIINIEFIWVYDIAANISRVHINKSKHKVIKKDIVIKIDDSTAKQPKDAK